MATSKINSVNFLPVVLQTDRNAKFLASTLDQLIQPTQLKRLDGYIGSTQTATYNSTSDVYLSNKAYDLDPAMVTYDSIGNIQTVQGYDDLINEISIKGGFKNNLDRLFRSNFYSFNSHVDWDKLVNYQNYFWLANGPEVIEITSNNLDIESVIIGQQSATVTVGNTSTSLSNGMLITFGGIGIEDAYREKEFFVEGVGTSIVLVPYQDLITAENVATPQTEGFDTEPFDDYSFDDDRPVPVNAEYVTINRASLDLNPWSRYNRWVHGDVIATSAIVNGKIPVYPSNLKAKRPIVEFQAGLQLINFGSTAVRPINIIDTKSTNAFLTINGSTSAVNAISTATMVDGISLEPGHRIIFNADENPDVRGKIYEVSFVQVDGTITLTLIPAKDHNPEIDSSVLVINGDTNSGTSWRYDGSQWQYAQQKTVLNQAPLFELYDKNGNSYADKNYYLCDFTGNKIFGYEIGTGTNDPYLGFPLAYRKIDTVGSFLFSNYLSNSKIVISYPNLTTNEISTNITYCQRNTPAGPVFENAWKMGVDYPIPLLEAASSSTYYQEPLSLTNNPLNSTIDQFTISEFTEHVQTIISRVPGYVSNNLRDLGDYTSYGNKLISNVNPIAFAQMFIGKKEHSVVDAITKAGDQYNQFKLTFLNSIIKTTNQLDPVSAVDEVLTAINQNNGSHSPYYLSDMVAYGNPEIQRTFTVTDPRNVLYPLTTEFDLDNLSLRSVLVYLNNNQLVYGIDYDFNKDLSSVNILASLNRGDVLVINDFTNTEGAYIPPTPTKLGLYPSFVPKIIQTSLQPNAETNLLTNGDFITGSTTGWDFGPPVGGYSDLVINPYTGGAYYGISGIPQCPGTTSTYTMVGGGVGGEAHAIQTIPSMPGATYVVSFYTYNIPKQGGGSDLPNEMTISLSNIEGNNVLLEELNINEDSSWEHHTYRVVATDNSMTLDVGIRQDPWFWLLGNISITMVENINTINVIQGHDGSITPLYNDYRDNIILELEKRIYNNIKVQYRPELLDINSVIPGAFRSTDYLPKEITEILSQDFVKWAGTYGIDYISRPEFNFHNSFTYNYTGSYSIDGVALSGYWRGVYKYFYDTDRPHTNPWEMLGFSKQPSWWTSTYGTNYSSTNTKMWNDLRLGHIAGTGETNTLYARPGLFTIIPVGTGNCLKNPIEIFSPTISGNLIKEPWIVGDQGPAENAWRKSSLWPYTVQKILALTIPATYASLMYDTSRMNKNIAGQWTYGSNETFLQLNNLYISGENNDLTSGYSVLVSEVGQQRTTNYISELRQDLDYVNYNLFHKVGGFVDKNTLQVIIDAYDPTSTDPGAILPSQNYKLILDVSNPIRSVSISGLIIQKSELGYIIKGYDNHHPYFTYYPSFRNINTQAITVGGKTETYLLWAPGGGTLGALGLTDVDVTTAQSAVSGNFYQKGQIVSYGNNYYRVIVAHQAESTFNTSYYQILSSLPSTGGATVQIANSFDTTAVQIPYGTTYSNIQEVYDLIIGYGKWITEQGFIFDQYNKDLGTVLDWNLTANEFLYWTTQNWSNGNILTLSPFADQIVYQSDDSVVDNLFNGFYDYSILKADGTPYPQKSLSISRNNGICTIATLPDTDGIYFARLNCIQKQHGMVFDNVDDFGDIIYDIQTGTRQMRMKLVGFKTDSWNGDFFSPGFIYDNVSVSTWAPNTKYLSGSVVYYNGNYYSAIKNIDPSEYFKFTDWNTLSKKPEAGLLPNLDYKISQFQDFYSLDIDNFDVGQEKMAQHLTGYTPRVYLNNIFADPIAQYKFYQGFIKQKGTKNAINALTKATVHNLQGQVNYNEEWAFRIGEYGSYTTYNELEVPLVEGTFLENPQIINFVDQIPSTAGNTVIRYNTPGDLTITPKDYLPSTTFVSTSDQSTMILTHAGYVRTDDVTATAYNENSLLDIANNSQLKNGDTIWLGFTQNGDWDVYRYTFNPAGVIGVYISSPVSQITFTTSAPHGLYVGELISIANFDSQVNGVYKVEAIPRLDQFTVASTLASIVNVVLYSPGQLFEFKTARVSDFDNLPSDKQLYKLPYGNKFWIDSITGEDQNWAVYEKINNYNVSSVYGQNPDGQGASISKRKGSNILVTGAPTYNYNNQQGAVFVYKQVKNNLQLILRYGAGSSYHNTNFGQTVVYDDIPVSSKSPYGLIFASAPNAANGGMVKVSTINYSSLEEGFNTYITNPNPSYGLFGESIWVQRNAKTKLILIGAPGTGTSKGKTWAYTATVVNSVINVSSAIGITDHNIIYTPGSQWGYSISGAEDSSYIAISAPGYAQNKGVVSIFDEYLNHLQTINSPFSLGDRFGQVLSMSPSGDILAISAPHLVNEDKSVGAVAIYNLVNKSYVLDQILENPVIGSTMNFGSAIDINTASNSIVISSLGTNAVFPTIFDDDSTTFDSGVTAFVGVETKSGAAYTYYKNVKRFVLAQELTTSTIATLSGTDFGSSVAIDDAVVFVGASAVDNNKILGGIYQFNQIDLTTNSISKIRNFENLTVPDTIEKVSLIDTYKQDIYQYLDIIDPLKGKIAGIAEQEIGYKLISDPAIYSLGLAGVNVDTNTNWLDDHVGELWWDLSTAKYLWYEQSDLEYRKNNWGKLFPGATIDVYEWVGSTLLPSEWSTQADTAQGLTLGISGQPKFPDNSIVSVKQIYDSTTNSYSNVYFYWVKNSVVVPNAKNRRISSYEIASVIADPSAYGIPFAALISPNAVALSNVGSLLVGDNISFNIAQDRIASSMDDPVSKHTEWLLLEENNENSLPNSLLEKKLFDSLLGHDSLGNLVPDPALSLRTRYGVGIRPRQSLFKNRITALQNIVEFVNNVLIKNLITGNYDFINLNAQESIPNRYLNIYDRIIEDNNELDYIDTTVFQQAVIQCIVNINGNVIATNVINAGFGYGILNPVYDNAGNKIGYQGPTFTSQGNGKGAVIDTMVDDNGSVIQATISNAGTGYSYNFNIVSRPQSVIVISDNTHNGGWTQYTYEYSSKRWIRARTQSYNTTLYWDYADWTSSDYNPYKIYSSIIGSPYELAELTLIPGQYIKINNSGNGNYIVIEVLNTGVQGTYGQGFNLVYAQNGTIQLSNSIWNRLTSNLGFDYTRSYDQTLWDQTPDVELKYILTALKENIFINALKVNWNLLFFTAVRYALSEQQLLDWAFKTSFINVTNQVGQLGQPPVYKLQDSIFYQQYINEVKPYHTQIRNFITQYNDIEQANTYLTDTDRKTDTTIKFDRISKHDEIGAMTVVDNFICDGKTTEFKLSWLAQPDKSLINLKITGTGTNVGSILGEDYTIKSDKTSSTLIFLNYAPSQGQTITITYQKNVNLLSAVERILNYYKPTSGMPGVDPAQLMTGVEYPGLTVGGQYEGQGFTATFGGWYPDSFIDGGTWTGGVSTTALGVNPSDIVIDGEYGFVTANTSYAPEEVVPGYTMDSLGINVYTKNKYGAPIVVNHSTYVSSTTTNTNIVLSTLPTTIDNILVSYNNIELTFVTDINSFISNNQYTIDWANSLLILPPQPNSGYLGYTIVGVGGGDSSGTTVGVVDKGVTTVANTSTATVQSLAFYDDIKDAYVTVNGYVCPPTTDPANVFGFQLTTAGNNSNRAAVTVYGLDPTITNTIQAWFFTISQDYFNVIHEQTFPLINFDINNPLTLQYPPGVIQPVSQQAIIEITDSYGTRRLMPPDTTYYSVLNPAQTIYNFTITSINGLLSNPQTYLNPGTVYVYVNGNQIRSGFDYSVNGTTVNIAVPLNKGDAIAIEAFAPSAVGNSDPLSGNPYTYQYRIVGNNLYLTPEAGGIGAFTIGNASLKVITYTDADGMLVETQKFIGDPNRRYRISRPIINDNYIFVTVFQYSNSNVFSYPLVNGVDYVVLDDNTTIQLSDKWNLNNADIVEVTSFASQNFSSTVLGYRIFNDILGNTSFTRLSNKNSTYLTQPLLSTDTEIHVADVSVLSTPQIDENIPGVVLIDRERIEFFKFENNVISQLRRGTLGTSPKNLLEVGTTVIDQGSEQKIPFTEQIQIQNTFTNTLTNSFAIVKNNIVRTYPNTSTIVQCDGITLSTSTLSINQLDVYYGGRLLKKADMYHHETTATYNSISYSAIMGSTATIALLPNNANVGDSYIVTSSNQVWTYTGSRTQAPSTTGWVFSGLKYKPQEYSVTITNSVQLLTLNTASLKVIPGLQITLVKKDYPVSDTWNTIDPTNSNKTLSLLDSTTTVARFLQEAPAVLPDNYFYGL